MGETCRDSRMGKDFFGTEFKVGDIVACLKPGTVTSWLVYGVVLKLSEKTSLIFTDRNLEGNYDLKKLCEAYLRDWTANGEDVSTMIKCSRGVNRRDNNNIVKHPANWTITGLLLNKNDGKKEEIKDTSVIPLQKNVEPFEQFSLLKHVDMVAGLNKTGKEMKEVSNG